jgi:hypothetical protein
MAQEREEIEDFLSGNYVKAFEDGETRVFEFDRNGITLESKNDFNGNPTKVIRYKVRDVNSMVANSWKMWDLSRAHGHIYRELTSGNGGKGWSVMEITREGLNKRTTYKAKGVN